jgi:hypothetical protein
MPNFKKNNPQRYLIWQSLTKCSVATADYFDPSVSGNLMSPASGKFTAALKASS